MQGEVSDEPVASDGRYRIVFCFANGAVTSDGKGHGDQGAIVKPYHFRQGTLQPALSGNLLQPIVRNTVHPTKAYLASWIARILSLKNSRSRNPYA